MSQVNIDLNRAIRDLEKLRAFLVKHPDYADVSNVGDDLIMLSDEIESVVKSHLADAY